MLIYFDGAEIKDTTTTTNFDCLSFVNEEFIFFRKNALLLSLFVVWIFLYSTIHFLVISEFSFQI